jgi:nucleotidyltransferase/DNA polymerase involved in DNA repair
VRVRSLQPRQVACLWVPYFGAVVARRADRTLEANPLILLDEQGRVLAADAHAASAGVAPGLSERQAAVRCPTALRRPAAQYPLQEAQDALWSQVRQHTDCWQPAGLGCVYLDMANASMGDGADLVAWCQDLDGTIRRFGWEPALGVTGSKFGADVARQMAGGNSALLIAPGIQRAFLAGQPAATLPLELDTLDQLRHLGIRTLGQFARLPAAGVQARFGLAGRTAQRWAQGLDDRPVIPPWAAAEVSKRIEFETPLADRTPLLANLAHHARRLLTPLQERLQAVSRLSLSITRADNRTISAGYTFPLPTAAVEPVELGLAAALDRVTWDGQPAAEMTLVLAGITDAPGQQLPLFEFSQDQRARLEATLRGLAARFGSHTFRLATLTEPESLLPEQRLSWHEFWE